MKAVILAAGEGRRMNGSLPKPLTLVLGLSLIERVILSAKECGIEEFLVVLGYRGEEIRDYLTRSLKSFPNLKINFIKNENWERENGTSLLAAKDFLAGEFLLLMSDHIFSPELLKDFLAQGKRGPRMVVLKDWRHLTNLASETKVKIEDGLVKDVGKELKEFDGIDAGIFLLNEKVFSPDLFSPINEKEREEKEITLSSIIKDFASRTPLLAFTPRDGYLINVNTKEAKKRAERIILDNQGKGSDGPISRFFNRRVSRHITRLIASFPVHPNLISVFSFFLSLLAGAAFFLSPLLGGILAQFSSIMDGVDGEVARIKFQRSPFGAFFDPILDRYGDSFILLGITSSLYLSTHNPLVFLIAFFALIGSFMSQLTRDRFFVVKGKEYPKEKEGWLSYFPITRDFRLFIVMLGGITNRLFLTLLILAFLTNLKTFLCILFAKKVLTKDKGT